MTLKYRQVTTVVALDFSAAFDMVNPIKLFKFLENKVEITDDALEWF